MTLRQIPERLPERTPRGTGPYAQVLRILGTKPMRVNTPIELHERIVEGLPCHTVVFLVERLTVLKRDEILRALNISLRTWHRMKAKQKTAPLDLDLSARVWTLAEVLSKATDVFGNQSDAEHWLATSAIGLNACRPIDLLATSQGAATVKTLLDRMTHGVYA